MTEDVGDAGDERRLGADDDEIDAERTAPARAGPPRRRQRPDDRSRAPRSRDCPAPRGARSARATRTSRHASACSRPPEPTTRTRTGRLGLEREHGIARRAGADERHGNVRARPRRTRRSRRAASGSAAPVELLAPARRGSRTPARSGGSRTGGPGSPRSPTRRAGGSGRRPGSRRTSESTSSFVSASDVIPLTRTAKRSATRSSQPQRRSRPVTVPNSPPSSRTRSCAGPVDLARERAPRRRASRTPSRRRRPRRSAAARCRSSPRRRRRSGSTR